MLVGLGALAFPPADIVVSGGLVLLIGLWSAGLGGLLTGIAGASFSSSRLQFFESAIEQGQILIMADVPKSAVEKYESLIRAHNPDVRVEGIEPSAPLIP